MAVVAATPAGKQVNELIIKQKLSAEEATRRVLGDIQTVIPQGAQILNQSLNFLEYRDKEGFIHRIQRNGDANSPDFGRLSEITDRPDVLPLTEQIPGLSGTLSAAQAAVQRGLGGNLAQLSPEDRAKIDAISKSTQEQLAQRFTREGGELITQLFGQGTQRSSLAGQAAADLFQSQGLVQNQALSDIAQIELGLQQFLSQLSTGAGLDVLDQLTGQETQRAIAGGQLGLGREQLAQQQIEQSRQFMLELEKFNASQRKSPLGAILGAITPFLSLIPGIGPALSAFGSLATGATQAKSPTGFGAPRSTLGR